MTCMTVEASGRGWTTTQGRVTTISVVGSDLRCCCRGLGQAGGSDMTVFDVASLGQLTGRNIAIDNHCFGCTAGAGSSCQGAVA